jgi:glucokinase
MEEFLGVDVGGTNVKFGLVNSFGTLLEKKKFSTIEMRESGDFINAFLQAMKEQLDTFPNVKKVGIGMPGLLSKDRTSTLELPNIPEFSNINLIQKLQSYFPNHSFKMENDAKVAALGELYFPKTPVPDSFIFITLGTGVGGAVILDRKLFKGGDGNALEIGHIVAGNGKTVEDNIGKKGIMSMTIKKLEKKKVKSELKDLLEADELSNKKIEKAVHKHDVIALEVFSEVGEILGDCIVSTVRLFDIKTIIIGGGVAETYDYLKDEMFKAIYKRLSPYYTNKLEIRVASLGNNAGIIGAASLCFITD